VEQPEQEYPVNSDLTKVPHRGYRKRTGVAVKTIEPYISGLLVVAYLPAMVWALLVLKANGLPDGAILIIAFLAFALSAIYIISRRRDGFSFRCRGKIPGTSIDIGLGSK